ncbi:MAG: RsmE family RNA methyltransferase, partial [Bdellovibrionota bacterium]
GDTCYGEKLKRFLVIQPLREGTRLTLSPEESKHAVRVMRLEPGAKVLLTNGKGLEAEATLVSSDKSGAVLDVLTVREAGARAYRLELLQGTLKGARMDWLVEKATELGVSAIHAVDTQFSVAGDRRERWVRVAQAALKQSGNLNMPDLHEVTSLDDAFARLGTGYHGFLLSPHAEIGLASAIRETVKSGTVVLAIGPEGGFSEAEEKTLQDRGFRPCRLSAQILRGETAALTAAAVALHALEFPDSNAL